MSENNALFEGSELRLFLSMDLAGSTALKNESNHAKLYETYQRRKQDLDGLREEGHIDTKFPIDDSTACIHAILHDYSQEDSDWARILESQFDAFHVDFKRTLAQVDAQLVDSKFDDHLWKIQGDELIYSFVVHNPEEVHSLVYAFLKVIRRNDQAITRPAERKKKVLRPKGCAWTAGFPIRNRELTVFDRKDFLGPDIDIGFRLGKHTYPGFVVASLDLADILGQANRIQQLRGMIVDWQILQGVWNEEPYPIIWVTLPSNDELVSVAYEPFHLSETMIKRPVVAWQATGKKVEELKQLRGNLASIRKRLPESLGLEAPYFGTDSDTSRFPPRHKTILKLLKDLPLGIGGPQEAEDVGMLGDNTRTKDEVLETICEEIEDPECAADVTDDPSSPT